MRITPYIIAAGLAVTTVAAEARDLEQVLDADGIDSIRIDVRVGELELERSNDGRIHIMVRLEPDDDWESDIDAIEEAIEDAELDVRTSGTEVSAEVDVRRGRGFDDGDIEETWIVRVPERFAADIEMNVGSMRVNDITGGVELQLNVGEMIVDIGGGSVDARVNVGELDVETRSDSVGEVRLEANVGDVRATVHGDRIRADERGWFSPGAEIDYDGRGRDDFELKVNVGDVSLRIDD